MKKTLLIALLATSALVVGSTAVEAIVAGPYMDEIKELGKDLKRAAGEYHNDARILADEKTSEEDRLYYANKLENDRMQIQDLARQIRDTAMMAEQNKH